MIRQPHTSVALLPANGMPEHEMRSHEDIAKRLARLLDLPYSGVYGAGDTSRPYLVPADTLELSEAAALGVHSEADLFGGIVAQPYMGGKTISHPLFRQARYRPPGWSNRLSAMAADAILPGYSAFSKADAIGAGEELLEAGPIRIKPVQAKAGRGQKVVHDRQSLHDAISGLDETDLEQWGLVLERNLKDVATYSVGQVRVAGMVASYWGTQNLTRDNDGEMVYGGSDLYVVRGDYEELLEHQPQPAMQKVIEQARQYEAAALATLSGLVISRRNYDVAQGVDAQGNRHSGVLEQSWRIGGASAAEVAALEAFAADPALRAVSASTLERYGRDTQTLADADLIYSGENADTGFLRKYVRIDPHEHD